MAKNPYKSEAAKKIGQRAKAKKEAQQKKDSQRNNKESSI